MVNGAGREDVIRVPMSRRVRRAKDRQEEEWDLERVRPPPARAGEDHRGCYGGADSEAAPAWEGTPRNS